MLTLRWYDVDLKRHEITIRADHAKDREHRILPISTRLGGVLELARTDPAGREYSQAAHVFGLLGAPLKSFKKAWETAVLRAHGHEPEWDPTGKLSKVSRAQFRAVDLHFHDLRHEAGSRLIERGWPIHHVQEMLGHASLEQTSTYLNVTRVGLHESMRRYDQTRIRGTSVSHATPIEQPPVCHAPSQTGAEPLVN